MKLLFDESLSPRLVSLLGDLFPQSEAHFETASLVLGIEGFWNMLQLMTSSWFRPTAILSVC
jgi:hypothetical protein